MDKVLQDERLHPKVRESAISLQNLAKSKGITILYTQGFRTLEYQAGLYAQGRTKPGKIVTNCRPGHSPHNYGLAVDFVPLVDGKAAWDRIDLFDAVGHLAAEYGLAWGGYFKSFVDKPHLENLFGLKISDLLAGKRPEKEDDLMTLLQQELIRAMAVTIQKLSQNLPVDEQINYLEKKFDEYKKSK